jgi:multidrug efflux pump subunit AcrA (membrane-fusion protein)
VVGEVTFNPAKVVAAGARTRGFVRKVTKVEGDEVKAGEVLAEMIPVVVKLGLTDGQRQEILEGISAGQQIVVNGVFALKSDTKLLQQWHSAFEVSPPVEARQGANLGSHRAQHPSTSTTRR